MTTGEQFELMLAVSKTRIPLSRREEMLTAMQDLLEDEDCPAKTPNEIVYMLAAAFTLQMRAYQEVAAEQIGGEILRKALG